MGKKPLLDKSTVQGSAMLLLTSFIWGTAFVAQSVGMDHVGPYTFNAARSYIGVLVLLPVMFFLKRSRPQAASGKGKRKNRSKLIVGGILCGVMLCVASLFQQVGIQHTTVGKAGFLTALYIVIVPILGIFMKKVPSPLMWGAVVLALVGTGLLSLNGDFTISTGDLYVMVSALFFSMQIIFVDKLIPYVDGVKLSAIQLFVSAVISTVIACFMENTAAVSLLDAAFPILYAGIMSSGIAYTLQILGQRKVAPAAASIIMSMESVFALLAGCVILGETITIKEICGCALLFAAVLMAQVPQKPNERKMKKNKMPGKAGGTL